MNERVILYSVPWCPKCHRIRLFLELAVVPYCIVNPEDDENARAELLAGSGQRLDVPAVKVGDRFLVDPDNETLAAALNVPVPKDLDLYDVAIIGGGPAGLTAAIYTARERLRTLVLEKGLPGGQAAVTDRIENYPGFPEPVSGAELMERVHRQAERFGAEVATFTDVTALVPEKNLFRLETPDRSYRACAVILATGSVYRRMGVPGEDALIGRGVSFCATCDAPFFRGKHVVVVGGGNSALQETVHLAQFASRITIVQLLDHLTGTRLLEERIRSLPSVEILLSHRVVEVLGTEAVEGVRVENVLTGEERRLECDGVFVFIGLLPNTDFLKRTIELDESGFAVADPTTLASSLPGVYVAGDVRSGSSKQITAAVGEGTVASFMVQQWLEARHKP
ncbi:MAG: FAD-dependent oxidoreductase [Deltaproteobacteria bacterium]|nr:FAD-dependent oxidoreductase [Deltaproteobacteria bacterium]